MAESLTNIVYTKKGKARVTFKISKDTVRELSIASAVLVGDFEGCDWKVNNGSVLQFLKDGSLSVTRTISDLSKSYQYKYFVKCIDNQGKPFDKWIIDDNTKIKTFKDDSGNVNSLLQFNS